MAPRFKFFLAALLLVFSPLVSGEDTPSAEVPEAPAVPAGPNSDALEMISKRMQSLTNSLQGMPQPPKFDQQINLPDALIQVPPANRDNDDYLDNFDNTSEKEN